MSKTDTNNPNLTLYVDHVSQPCRAVLLFCREANIPFTEKRILLHKGQHRTPEFQAISPTMKLPVITENGFTLTESSAILRYLCDTRKVAEHWLPRSDLRLRARHDEWLDWRDAGLRHGATRLTLIDGGMMQKMHIKWKPDTQAVFHKEATYIVHTALDKIERSLKQTKTKFLCGDELSVVDLSISAELYSMYIIPFDFTRWPKVMEWLNLIKAQCFHWESVHKTLLQIIAQRNVSNSNDQQQQQKSKL